MNGHKWLIFSDDKNGFIPIWGINQKNYPNLSNLYKCTNCGILLISVSGIPGRVTPSCEEMLMKKALE